ncbi:hypothetical protein BJY01DRAFT_252526 [Aspergillus pseudoustus]|uniref:Uncharacterized protein n=1 Tax=Aspergillus pseudoustus TaxID=1810923 RepID=A0ABR4J694_9EURO
MAGTFSVTGSPHLSSKDLSDLMDIFQTTNPVRNVVGEFILFIHSKPDWSKALKELQERLEQPTPLAGRLRVTDKLKSAILYLTVNHPGTLRTTLSQWPGLSNNLAVMLVVMGPAARLSATHSMRIPIEFRAPIPSSVISFASGCEMSDMLTDGLVQRRQHFQSLAFEKLQLEDAKELGLSRSILPDIVLLPLCNVPSQYDVDVTSYRQRTSHLQSVFHAGGLSPPQMARLWGAGFRDIDALDEFGRTPLMIWDFGCTIERSISRVQWLVEHGADTRRTFAEHRITVSHHLSLNLMHEFIKMCYQERRVSKTRENAMEAVYGAIRGLNDSARAVIWNTFQFLVYDSCGCRCSIDGCTPLSIALRHIHRAIQMLSSHEEIKVQTYRHDLIRCVYETIIKTTDDEARSPTRVAEVVLRLLTFDSSGLTHTCCRKDSFAFSHLEREANEIQDEEQHLLQDFEDILASFQAQYLHLRIPLWGFLESYWSGRMLQHLKCIGEPSSPSALCAILWKTAPKAEEQSSDARIRSTVGNASICEDRLALIGARSIAETSLEFLHLGRELALAATSSLPQILHQPQLSGSPSKITGPAQASLFSQAYQAVTSLFGRLTVVKHLSRSSTRQTLTGPHNARQQTPGSAKYLLLSVPSRRVGDRLIHLDLQDGTTDEQLYHSLRKVYTTSRMKWNWVHNGSFNTLSSTFTTATKSHSSRKAEEDWPQCGCPTCEKACKQAIDYEYSPRPAHVDPPIPRQALMHFLEYPDHAGSKTFYREALPKREHFLSLGPNEHLREGWYLAFIEAASWPKIAAIEGLIAIGSLVFSMAWIEIHGTGSISDAFAPSCWMRALGAIILTLIYHHEQ